MQEKEVYEYAFIRLVPKVEREEFINVGVIVFCKRKRFLKVKYHIDERRIRAFSEQVDLAELAGHLHTWDLICEGSPEGGAIARLEQPERFRWLTAARSTIIQSSQVHPGICGDPDAVLDELFRKYVLI